MKCGNQHTQKDPSTAKWHFSLVDCLSNKYMSGNQAEILYTIRSLMSTSEVLDLMLQLKEGTFKNATAPQYFTRFWSKQDIGGHMNLGIFCSASAF